MVAKTASIIVGSGQKYMNELTTPIRLIFELFFSLKRPQDGLLAVIYQTKEAATTNKCTFVDGNFGGHADAAVQCGLHHPMDHIQGFTRSHWMLSSDKCLRRIASAAAKGINFE
jgi:hypothetical protein